MPPTPPPDGRFLLAFDDATLIWSPTWTRIDSYPNLVASYQIDRGRQYELDRTDVGRATVILSDRDGILDPSNPDGPYFGKIEPLLQAMIGRYNPVTDTWHTRYRGFVEDFDYDFDRSQQVNRLTVTLVDLFEILAAIEMHDQRFSDDIFDPLVVRPDVTKGQVFFEDRPMDDRIKNTLDRALIPEEYRVVFSGNVRVWESVYTPGESPMTAVQEAADAEFPGVSNVYCDRLGRLCVHGRLAKFDPAGVLAGVDDTVWDWHHWHAGDGAAVNDNPATTAHLREFAFNRGLAKIINHAYATPSRAATGVPLTDAEIHGQLVTDDTSIDTQFGIRAWSAENLLTKTGLLEDTTDLEETKRFAQYYVANYSQPRDRVTACGFRTMHPDWTGAAVTWNLLSQIDISDRVDITLLSPGGGGFESDNPNGQFYVEGIHETCQPLNPDYDDITVRLDLSPVAYFTDLSMFPEAP